MSLVRGVSLELIEFLYIFINLQFFCNYNSLLAQRDHPFKKSAFLRERGVKNWPNLPTDGCKNLPTEGGRGQKS